MIPVEMRMALWDLMEAIEKADGLVEEDKVAVAELYAACQKMSDYIIARNRAGQEI